MSGAVAARQARSRIDKFEARRAELAEATLSVLTQRGLAHTSLRDIAEESGFSHGVLHYYFEDRTELIIACVRQYKSQCVGRYEALLQQHPLDVNAVVTMLEQTSIRDAAQQRLWYSMRVESTYNSALWPAVEEIDRTLGALIATLLHRIAADRGATLAVSDELAYRVLDGVLAAIVRARLGGEDSSAHALTAQTGELIEGWLVVSA